MDDTLQSSERLQHIKQETERFLREFLKQANDLTNTIAEAKTSTKKAYFQRKLDKLNKEIKFAINTIMTIDRVLELRSQESSESASA